jgi:multisubunit Na+/H+ antiporter MnhB subunit
MSRSLRLSLLILGLVLLCLSLIALAYTYWPIDTAIVDATLEPTLFSPP